MLKQAGFALGVCVLLILVLNPPSFSQTDSVIATIWLPDEFTGVLQPRAFTYNSINNKMYVCGGRKVIVIDGETDQKIGAITVGRDARALTYNSTNNKVYCANRESGDVTVIDGATDMVLATVRVGDRPIALTYNAAKNKIYCANAYSDNVAVIDGDADSVISTAEVWGGPGTLTYNSIENKIYCTTGWEQEGPFMPDILNHALERISGFRGHPSG